MRTKSSWSDCFPLQIYWTWIVAGMIAAGLFLVSECAPREAHAGAYLDMAGGGVHALITAAPGDYTQSNLPHSFDTNSLAYKVGAGWRFNDRWSIGAAYVNFGTTVKQSAIFVPDENWNPKGGHCLNGCTRRNNYRMTDAYHGGELTVTRTFTLFEDWAWHLKAGGAYLMHRFTLNVEDGNGQSIQHYGRYPATVAGVGASYKWAYLEADYYHGLGGSNGFMGHDQGWPLSKEMIVTWFGVKIPLS